ncbi:hypothetical protein [Nostoc sp.]|uniref:hypothetical protein n=1 Tax=Nostoc sp. TaxID=1180 RepID=UPI002FF931C4
MKKTNRKGEAARSWGASALGSRPTHWLPFARAGLGWGKILVNQLFQTCVYTVGKRGGS